MVWHRLSYMTNAQIQPTATMDTIIGENVYMLMFRNGMKQTELALKLGMTQGALSRKLRGDRPWYSDEIKDAADTFGLRVDRLFVKLPDLDSNQEPIGFESAAVSSLEEFRAAKMAAHSSVATDHDSTVPFAVGH